MRPRPDAAENPENLDLGRASDPASMRPRPDAAENTQARVEAETARSAASMRPRPDAAENSGKSRPRPRSGSRFNEAAARCRGKRRQPGAGIPPAPIASMRPRPDAAENMSSSLTTYRA